MTCVLPALPRQTVQVRFSDGRTFDGPMGTTAEAFVRAAFPEVSHTIVAGLINGKLRELSEPLLHDTAFKPIYAHDSDGVRIYRRSLCFLMIAASAELFPNHPLAIQHSMPFGGYYCERTDGRPLADPDLTRLKERMQALVAADIPITQVRVPLPEALHFFRASGDIEKADLFTRRRKGYVTLYELNGVQNYFHGFMVPRTGYLQLFDLHPYANGFILQFPRRHQPDVLQPFEDEPWLAEIFRNYAAWLRLVGVPDVAALNHAVTSGRIAEAILIAEALHNRQLASIANDIDRLLGQVRVVFISGPTSAGKTTFSKRLAVQLLARGVQPVTMALDNYFVNREDSPRDENGDYDFERLEAIDLPLFQEQLYQLLRGERITQPVYNFITGKREWGRDLSLKPNQVILIEGIHGLNPHLAEGLPPEALFRIFISAFTQLNLDKHNRIPTTDTRKLRRIVRDFKHRGYSAADTIRRWTKVREGEKNYIFPYQHHANAFFNSALVYELAVLKSLASPILLQVEPDTEERIEANRLLAFLQWFDPIPADQVAVIPGDSILREFIGGSIMENFEPWID